MVTGGDERRSPELGDAKLPAVLALLAIVVPLVVFSVVTNGGGSRDSVVTSPSSRPGVPEVAPSSPAAGAGTPGPQGGVADQVPSYLDAADLQKMLDGCLPLVDSTDLVVVTYNIKSGALGRGLAGIAAELAAMKPDIVLLQEVRGQDQPEQLAAALGFTQTFGINMRLRGGTVPYGTAVLSRFPITDAVNVALPNEAGREQRGLLRAVLDVNGTPLTVYVTHLQHDSARLRRAQVGAVVRALEVDPQAKIVGGDLNDDPASPVLRAAYSALADTWAAVGRGPGGTVPVGAPRARIDYLLYGQAEDPLVSLVPYVAEVMPAGSSDHRAVRAVYTLNRAITSNCGAVTPSAPAS